MRSFFEVFWLHRYLYYRTYKKWAAAAVHFCLESVLSCFGCMGIKVQSSINSSGECLPG